MADLFVLTRNPYNLQAVQARFAGAELTPLLDSFLAAGERVLNEPFRVKDPSGNVEADAWASRTLAHLRRPPALLRGRLLRHWLRYYAARFFGNATLRRKYLDDIRNPETVRRFLGRHWDSLRGFQ
jgi:hypothetical protein